MKTTCCACFASNAALMSKGCKVFPHSLHDAFAGHLRVNRSEIRIRPSLAEGEGEGELLVRIQHFGFEDPVRAHDCMWNVVAIRPRHACAHRHRECRRSEAEVIDLHFRCRGLFLRGRQEILRARRDHSHSEYESRCHDCDRRTSPHAFSSFLLNCRSDWFLALLSGHASVESTTASACCP